MTQLPLIITPPPKSATLSTLNTAQIEAYITEITNDNTIAKQVAQASRLKYRKGYKSIHIENGEKKPQFSWIWQRQTIGE